jgi:hypothetical protein
MDQKSFFDEMATDLTQAKKGKNVQLCLLLTLQLTAFHFTCKPSAYT